MFNCSLEAFRHILDHVLMSLAFGAGIPLLLADGNLCHQHKANVGEQAYARDCTHVPAKFEVLLDFVDL